MGARRNDIPAQARVSAVLEILSPERCHGAVTRRAHEMGISRQTIYAMATKTKARLEEMLTAGQHGPVAQTTGVEVNRVKRMTVVLCECGVSQRGTQKCLAEGLDVNVSLGWVNQTLSEAEAAATRVNAEWRPQRQESLSGDEIYSQGEPNLLVVGNESLYVYELIRQPDCTAETWGCVLLNYAQCPQFNSDAGVGLAGGVKLAEMPIHQLDWDHILRPMWGQAARCEAQAYDAMTAYETRLILFNRANSSGRLAQHLNVLDRLESEMTTRIARADAYRTLAEQADAEFGLIERSTGEVRDPHFAAQRLRALGQQFKQWPGAIYEKVSSYFCNLAAGLFGYVPVLQRAMQPLIDRWGTSGVQALTRVWQSEADARRHARSGVEQQRLNQVWVTCLDNACATLGDQLWSAWDEVAALLGKVWRGSSLAECVNSKLRPVLNRRDQTDPGCLALFQFLHNTHVFARGKRAGHSPAQLVHLDVPADPLTLLGLAPKCQSNSPAF
jgi:hypothetical protein